MSALSVADAARLAYVGRQPATDARDSDSWYTPRVYLDAVRQALGGTIDLDPYTSTEANARVGASFIYTLDSPAPAGALWRQVETLFMNPPYSNGAVRAAVDRLLEAFDARRFSRGIVLVNNASETRFFQKLLKQSAALCLPGHRIAFENVDGKRVSGNTRGQTFFFLSRDPKAVNAFAGAFQPFGPVLKCGRSLVVPRGL